MTARHTWLMIPWLALLPAPAGAAAVVLPDNVTVRIYDTSNLPAAVTDGALAVAGRTLGAADVGVAWHRCGGRTPRLCDRPARAGDILLRLVEAAPRQATAGEGPGAALRSRRGLPLGDAFVGGGSGSGVLATIYIDRVRLLAEAAGTDAQTLLGYAIAHELGHLLLASTTHGPRGIMRATWSSEDLRRARASDWEFTREEREAIRRRRSRDHPTSDGRIVE